MAALDRLVDTLERDSRFRCFVLDGQAVLIEDYLDVRPEQASRVRRLASRGRLLHGPWYVLADEQLSSDESLVRNLLIGQRVARKAGSWLRIGYSPDAFGHPAALPSILSGFGIRHAILWRGYGGQAGQERDLFRWISPDGASVLVHHLPRPGYEIGAAMPAGDKALRAWWESIEALLGPRATAPLFLLPSGADHHAANPALPDRVARLSQVVRGHQFRVASPEEYFTRLPRPLNVPAVQGELRFSYGYTWTLQDTHSTRSSLKRAITESDRLLVRWAEPHAALAAAAGGDDRRPLLTAAWKDHLRNLFHDSLCGSISDEVALDVAQRARSAATQARGILVDALHDRLGQDRDRARSEPGEWQPALVVINPQPRALRQVVEATVTVFEDHVVVGGPGKGRRAATPAIRPPVLRDARGRVVATQVLEEYTAFERLDSPGNYPDQDRVRAFRLAIDSGTLPGLGIKAFRVEPGSTATRPRAARPATPADLTLFSELIRVESDRDEGDTYTFEPVAGDRPLRARWARRGSVVWPGPLVAAIERGWIISGRAQGTVILRRQAGSDLLRVIVSGINLTGSHRLRIVLPVGNGDTGPSVADMQFGATLRPHVKHQRADFPGEWPAHTAPMHRWVSLPDAGVTVMARGSFEYEVAPSGDLAVTVLRAVGDLSRGDLRARPGHAAWPQTTPQAQEPGPFRVELAIAPVAVKPDSTPAAWDVLDRMSEEFHAAPAGLMLRYGIDVPAQVPGPTLEGAGLSFRALKPSERGKGIVVRCVNLSEREVHGSWTWPRAIRRAFRARLDETPVERLPLSRNGRQVRFTAAPRAIVTVLIES